MQAILRVPSPAKLNLFLHITGRRTDGYHELQTIFQLIDLYDWLSFHETSSQEIQIHGLSQVDVQDNLIYKAAMLLKPFATRQYGVQIQLEKNIPMGAGLGGGSSNAATTLLILNQLWQCHFSNAQLAELGMQLGADVPVFIHGTSAWAEGVGEKLTCIDLPQKQYIVLKPDCFISTQTLFAEKSLTRDAKPSKFCAYQQTPSTFENCFEPIAKKLYPEVNEAWHYLNTFGRAQLTGTGACVFVEVNKQMDTDFILKHAPCQSYMVSSLKESPVHAASLPVL